MNPKIKSYIDENITKESFKNKNVFITGGNSGIGFELAKECAYLGSNIFLLCRSLERAESAKEKILEEYPNTKIEIIHLDLADLSSIKETTDQIKKFDVHYFVNNAGVYRQPGMKTKQGYELITGTNFIGTLYLNDLLMDYFKSLNHEVHILFETSLTAKFSKFRFNDFFFEKRYSNMKVYAQSKLGISAMYFEYCKSYINDQNMHFSLVHPGIASTDIINKGYKSNFVKKYGPKFVKTFFNAPDKSALTLFKALDSNEKCIQYEPRGILGSKGYPRIWKNKKPSNGEKAIKFVRDLISNNN